MKQYQAYAHSPSLTLKLEEGRPLLNEQEATRLAARTAEAYRAINYKGADDWEAWVRIERQD
jgi:hypothetical protein